MQKELWRNRWLGSLNELTSLILQRESWLDKSNTNPHWSFGEFMCSYFDDLGIDDNYDNQLRNEFISKNEFEIIKVWHESLDKYNSPNDDDNDHESILADEKWQKIVEEGKNAVNKLKELLNANEIQVIEEEVDYTKYK